MRTYIVDAFTDVKFSGNPAGVCFPETDLADSQMLLIAQELSLSETAFVRRLDNGPNYSIRFFSPIMEIPLCGHATLASAKVILEESADREVAFRTIEGERLVATATEHGIVLKFPSYQTRPTEAPPALLAALGLKSVQNAEYNHETKILLLEIENPNELAALEPDFVALPGSHAGINGVLVTAPSGRDGYDFHSRYFWPWSGANEDPVTGGTHTFLAKYWADRLGKSKLQSFQSSKRTGFMQAEIAGGNVYLTSQAVIVLRGEIVN